MPGRSPFAALATTRLSIRGGREAEFWTGLARAFAGALLFSVPLLMTMEMWWLGFYMYRFRLAFFLGLMLPVLVGLSYYSGMKETRSWVDATVDAVTGAGVGIVVSALILALFGVIHTGMSAREVVGKIALQSASTGFGAVLARSQFGGSNPDRKRKKQRAGYAAELFFMGAGALYLGYTVAPTQEMILIAYKMDVWRALALLLLSMALMHAFVYAIDLQGMDDIPMREPWWSLFLRFTVPGYLITLAVSAFSLWIFGRFEDYSLHWVVLESIVLGFPGSIGAAAARLVF